MAKYIPKSKINIREAGPVEFILKKTRKPYTGPYIETSKGRYYAGSNPQNLSVVLVKPKSIPNNFGKNKNTSKYNILNKQTYSLLKNIKNIVATKNIPTDDDYKLGSYKRYFIKKVNELYGYFEVDKKTYDSINNKKKEYNHQLYDVGQILWSLVGNVKKTNRSQIFLQRESFPYLYILFTKLDEFVKTESRLIENLFTKGKELYYKDGREYKGDYHIHPGTGPMVGSKHTSKQHETLYYEVPQENTQTEGDIILGKPVTSLSEISPEYTLSTPTPSTNISPMEDISPMEEITSGGGGGGY